MSKAAAGRDKDRLFCKALLKHGYVALDQVLALVPDMPLDTEARRRLRATLRRWAAPPPDHAA